MNTQIFIAFFEENSITISRLFEIFGYIGVFFGSIATIAGIFWYVFRGKDKKQLQETVTNYVNLVAVLEKTLEQSKQKIVELDAELSKVNARVETLKVGVREAEDEQEELRKNNLRLQGELFEARDETKRLSAELAITRGELEVARDKLRIAEQKIAKLGG